MHWNLLHKQFIAYLRIEKGLAENTCLAYQQDLQKLTDYCLTRQLAVESVTYEHLKELVSIFLILG